MSELRTEKKFDYQGLMTTLAASGMLGCFGFLWSLNVTATKLEASDAQKSRDIDKIQQTVNNLQLSTQDVRERIIRIEGQKQIQPQ